MIGKYLLAGLAALGLSADPACAKSDGFDYLSFVSSPPAVVSYRNPKLGNSYYGRCTDFDNAKRFCAESKGRLPSVKEINDLVWLKIIPEAKSGLGYWADSTESVYGRNGEYTFALTATGQAREETDTKRCMPTVCIRK